jgi:hypothetical protein
MNDVYRRPHRIYDDVMDRIDRSVLFISFAPYGSNPCFAVNVNMYACQRDTCLVLPPWATRTL